MAVHPQLSWLQKLVDNGDLLLKSLPQDLAEAASVGLDPMGDLYIEWYDSPEELIHIDVGLTEHHVYVYHTGGPDRQCSLQPDQAVPQWVVGAIRELTEGKSNV